MLTNNRFEILILNDQSNVIAFACLLRGSARATFSTQLDVTSYFTSS